MENFSTFMKTVGHLFSENKKFGGALPAWGKDTSELPLLEQSLNHTDRKIKGLSELLQYLGSSPQKLKLKAVTADLKTRRLLLI